MDNKEKATMSLPARYHTLCIPCGESIEPGEFIIGHPEAGFIHEECAEDVGKYPEIPGDEPEHRSRTVTTLPRGKTAADRCGVCFQIPASNGVCGCS